MAYLLALQLITAQSHHLGTPGEPEWTEFAGRTPEGYIKMVETQGERMFVATLDDVVVGFASWKDIELCSLYVDPDHNGKGIGRALHQACDDDASTLGRRIIRVDSTLTGRTIYERLGYRVTRRTFHRNGGVRIPALAMHRRPT